MASFVGAIAIADLVKTTLGPKGMDKILQSVGDPNNIRITITNDGIPLVLLQKYILVFSIYLLLQDEILLLRLSLFVSLAFSIHLTFIVHLLYSFYFYCSTQSRFDRDLANEGATILKSVPVENPAAKVLVEIAKTQDDTVGELMR